MATIKDKLEIYGINKALAYMDSDYERNVPKALDWLELFDREGNYSGVYDTVREVMADQENNWHIFLKNIYSDLDKEARQMLLENFIVNASIIGRKKRLGIGEKEGCNMPWAILLDPTSACNLKCIGCWAAEYGNKLSLSLETIDRIINEANALGIYMFIYSGGEPLLRKDDIITLCEKHSDSAFLAFTNGTLIDECFAKEMQRVHNFVPAISIEGFEASNDSRRGEGTYQRVVKGMEVLRKYRQPFGISVCYTSENVKEVVSDEFIDDMIAKGAKFCWYFTYIPIGKDARPELMATARDREFMYQEVRRFRKEKPIFIMDFWNDGEFVEGCIAGGRKYLHINANGDVEPCAFIHYANLNIKNVSLMEALKSPLFMEYKKGTAFQRKSSPALSSSG